MAGGVSKHYERSWVYEPSGPATFENRVGKLLSQGNDLKATFKKQALETAKKAIAFEDEQAKHRAYDPTTANSDFYHQADGANPNAKPAVDTRGYVWVTKDGQMVANASNQSFNELPPPPTPRHALTTESQKFMASMDATQRSMYMWRKINPGCMECNTTPPPSTYNQHFTYDPSAAAPPNKERFRMKTDFTTYADMRIKYASTQGPK